MREAFHCSEAAVFVRRRSGSLRKNQHRNVAAVCVASRAVVHEPDPDRARLIRAEKQLKKILSLVGGQHMIGKIA